MWFSFTYFMLFRCNYFIINTKPVITRMDSVKKVYIFEKASNGEWMQMEKLLPDVNVYKFVICVVVSKDTTIVGVETGLNTVCIVEKTSGGA